jgi:hypothetical protein
MKKVLTTILAFVYLSTSMGATVHLHYCMGKLVSWGLINHDSKNCTICGAVKNADNTHCISAKSGCCKDEHKQVKTNGDQKIVSSDLQFLKLFSSATTVSVQSLPDFRVASFAIAYPTSNAPPDIGKVAVFILNRNFRI